MEGPNFSEEKRQIKYDPSANGGQKKSGPKPRNVTLKADPSYGCLKNGKKPTYRAAATRRVEPTEMVLPVQPPPRTKTMKHYTSFGKTRNATVRVLIKDQKTVAGVEREKRRLDKHPLSVVCEYLAKRNLYQAGSDAPEDVLRETYRNAHLAGNVFNRNDEVMINNYLSSAI
jgi:hypothetical protein